MSRYAEANGWALTEEVAGDPSRDIAPRSTWQIASQVHLHYSEDLETGAPFVHVTASVPNIGQGFLQHAEQHLSCHPWNDLLSEADAGSNAAARAKALLRLALGSPREYDPELAERIFRAGRDSDETVRAAAVYATSYSPSGHYRPFLQDLAANDPAPRVRQDAGYMIEAFDEIGIGGS